MTLALKFLIIKLVIIFLATSCSYDKTTFDIGSLLDPTWDFSKSSELTFDENFVEVKDGKVQLKPLELKNEGDDFNDGSHIGTHFSSSNQKTSLIAEPIDSKTHLNTIFPDKAPNLVGYWRFDDGFEDSSSYSNDGISSGGAVLNSSSKLGDNALLLDGDNDYISIADSSSLNISNAITISLWFNSSSLIGNDGGLISKSLDSVNKYFGTHSQKVYELGILDNTLYFQISDGVNTNSVYLDVSSYINGNWNHVVAVWEGAPGINNLLIFINGVQVAQANSTITEIQSTQDVLDIGGQSTIYNFSGFIDEVGLWNTNLSAVEIRHLYETQNLNYTELSPTWTPKYDHIIGYWKMDGNWVDSSGNGHHGTAEQTPTFEVNNPIGSHATLFDQTNEAINVGNSTDLNLSNLSLMAWIKMENSPDFDTIISKYEGGGYILRVQSSNLQFILKDGSFSDQTLNFPNNSILSGWHHIVATYDQTTMRLFIDGLQVANSTDASGVVDFGAGTQPFCIGAEAQSSFCTQGSSFSFDGMIDDVSVWGIPLSSSDINLIYNRQKQKYAGHYDSEVMNLGNEASNWPDLSWSTSLPFGKELVGDFDNDGTADSESSSDYSDLGGDLNNGLVGYWPLNEIVLGGVGSIDDLSGSFSNGTPSGTLSVGSGKFNQSLQFDGNGGRVFLNPSGQINWSNNQEFSFSFWLKPDFYYDNPGPGHTIPFYLASSNGYYAAVWLMDNGMKTLHFLMYSNPSSTTTTALPGSFVEDDKWYHICGTVSGSVQSLYVDGVLVDTGTSQDMSTNNLTSINLDHNNDHKGAVDEVAVWNRALTVSEVTQLYRRGANRIKFQVKSCIDSTCECKSFSSSPAGSATDCDGDTIVNALDFDDPHKAQFIGPGGDGTTYYSEAFNRKGTDTLFNCGNNTSDSDGNICVDDEIRFLGGVKPTGPVIDYSNFPLAARPLANPYFQYRVYMEADNNTACDGSPCLPELTSVNLNPGGLTKYYGSAREVKPTKPLAYKSIESIKVNADDCVTFQLSPDGINYFYVSGESWGPATEASHLTTKFDLESHIVKFSNDHGPGFLHIKAFLQTNSNQTSSCSLNDIDVIFTSK